MAIARTFPFSVSLLLLALFAGCSGPESDDLIDFASADARPGDRNRTAPAVTPAPTGAIVVYADNDSVVSAVATDGQTRTVLAEDATYRGATEDGWVIVERGQALAAVRATDGTVRILDDSPGSKWFRGVFDTDYIVYQVQAGELNSIHVVRADGTGQRVPVPPQPRSIEFIAVTPAGRVLYQACDPMTEPGSMRCIDERLESTTLAGTDTRTVLAGRPLIRHITVGDLLVYDRTTEAGSVVSVVTSDGRGRWDVSQPESFYAGVLPNGRIVYNRREYGQLDLYSVAADGTAMRPLARSSEDEFYAGAVPGGPVLFVQGAPGARRLYSVDEATGDIRALQVNGDNHVRAVAPDGTVILSARFGPDIEAQDNLYSVRPEGTALRALADSSDMEWFEGLAPDGRVIYMRCAPAPSGPCGHPSAQSDLYSIRQDATGMTTLAATSDFETARVVTRDNVVVYGRLAGGQWDLYGVPTTGGSAQPLADTASDERFMGLIEAGTAGDNPG